MTVVYPQYETSGKLEAAVLRFREWLQNTIIDIEVANETPHPTVDPSVHTILVGHSMGGIVAADTLLSIVDDDLVHQHSTQFPFPHIAGILAFDTPYLGLTPGTLAYAAHGKWKTATTAYSTVSTLASGLFAGQAAGEASAALATTAGPRAAPAPSLWGRWGKVAALSGAAAALAAGAGAAYMKRDDLSAGVGWLSAHMEFVGALMRPDEQRARALRVAAVDGVGFANCFTSLGGDRPGTLFAAAERTFCTLPAEDAPLRRRWYRCVNAAVDDEVAAHVAMFEAKTNPAYYELAERARGLVALWVKEDMYLPVPAGAGAGAARTPGFLRRLKDMAAAKAPRRSAREDRNDRDIDPPAAARAPADFEKPRRAGSGLADERPRKLERAETENFERPRRAETENFERPRRAETENFERPRRLERAATESFERPHRLERAATESFGRASTAERDERQRERDEKHERRRDKEERRERERLEAQMQGLAVADRDAEKREKRERKERKERERRGEAEFQTGHESNPWCERKKV